MLLFAPANGFHGRQAYLQYIELARHKAPHEMSHKVGSCLCRCYQPVVRRPSAFSLGVVVCVSVFVQSELRALQAAGLNGSYQCCGIDLEGQGDSPVAEHCSTLMLQRHADDLLAVVECLSCKGCNGPMSCNAATMIKAPL